MPLAVILTALPVEYLAVRQHLTDLKEETHPQGTIYERGKFVSNTQIWDVGIAEVGTGNAGSAIEAERALNYFRPDVLFFVGIAGGIKDVKVGSVVVATKVYSYESGKVSREFLCRPEAGQSSYAIVQRARAEAKKGKWIKRLPRYIKSEPNVFIAPIAAGEKVIASRKSELFKFLRSNYNDAISVEMEGYGFLKAAFAYPNIQTLVIRGISDLIKDKNANDPIEGNEEERQKRASQNASAFAFELLSYSVIQQTIDNADSPRKTNTLIDIETNKNSINSLRLKSTSYSDKGILKLHKLLLTKKYKEADQETISFILRMLHKEPNSFLAVEDIPKINGNHLLLLSNIWNDYSSGILGFRKQAEIWNNLGGAMTHEMEVVLGKCFGWRSDNTWKEYSNLNFSTQKNLIEGQFPAFYLSDACWRGELFLVNFLQKVSLSI